jgi:hypothetical protein
VLPLNYFQRIDRAIAACVRGVLLGLAVIATAGCGQSALQVKGMVKVDGQPLPQGTIHLELVGGAEPVRGGGGVQDGVFAMGEESHFVPGQYKATVEGFRKTGRTVNDPQRGPVEEKVAIALRENTVDVNITPENAQQLEISLSSNVRP